MPKIGTYCPGRYCAQTATHSSRLGQLIQTEAAAYQHEHLIAGFLHDCSGLDDGGIVFYGLNLAAVDAPHGVADINKVQHRFSLMLIQTRR